MRHSLDPALVLAVLTLVCASGFAQAPSNPIISLSMAYTGSGLMIRGFVSSMEHEAILRQSASRHFPGKNLEIDVQIHSPMPDGWSRVTDNTLRAMAQTHSSTALLEEHFLRIRAIVTDGAAWSQSEDRIRRSLLNGMRLEVNVLPVEEPVRFDRLCEDQFLSALRIENVEFRKSSAAVGTNASRMLDALVEIAFDCPSLSITVTGHTDNTGNETINLDLSKARAESVVAYMSEHGIEPARLEANGAGSALPIASNEDAAGRQVNRRIEFELKFRGF